MNDGLRAIIGLARDSAGLDLAAYREEHLRDGVARRMRELAAPGDEAYLERLARAPGELELLAASLANTYSLFFRNLLDFSLIESCALPELLQRRRAGAGAALRIWSAGCAEGQEPYSLAMLADSAAEGGAPAMIFATDSSRSALRGAERGEYPAEALQNLRLSFLDRYFERLGGSYRLGEGLREAVRFSHYDLLDRNSSSPPESIYGHFDIACCCNLLIYYSAQAQEFILGKLRSSLAEGGYLMVGESERALVDSIGGFRPLAALGHVFTKA